VITTYVGFENPSRNKANLWVEEETRRAVSEDSRMYEDKKFETSNVLDVIGGKNPLDPGEIISDNEVRYISSDENRFPDVESFTAEGVLRKEIEESEVTKLGGGLSSYPRMNLSREAARLLSRRGLPAETMLISSGYRLLTLRTEWWLVS
jgi:hypothetical protein